MSPSLENVRLGSGTTRLTMADIARLAGVDVSTVSRALADSSRVTDETKERIRKIVEENGYVVNHGARMLRNKMAGKVLVLLPNIAATAFPEIILGIEETLHKEGMSVVIANTQYDRAIEDIHARQLLNGAADGIILLTGRVPDVLSSYPGLSRKIVAVARMASEGVISNVDVDNIKVTETAVRHLLRRGYSDIAHIAGPEDSPTSLDRIVGYQITMEQAGLSAQIRVESGNRFNIEGGRHAMEKLLRNGKAPAAVVCGSDDMAMGAIRYARSQGLRVPHDIAFVGIDDIPFAAVYEPALTTVRIPRRKMGELGAQMLLKNLKTSNFKPKNAIVGHELIIRDSCGGQLDRKSTQGRKRLAN